MATAGPIAPSRAPIASRELLVDRVRRGRDALVMWHELVNAHGFAKRYASVRRFVGRRRGDARAVGHHHHGARRGSARLIGSGRENTWAPQLAKGRPVRPRALLESMVLTWLSCGSRTSLHFFERAQSDSIPTHPPALGRIRTVLPKRNTPAPS